MNEIEAAQAVGATQAAEANATAQPTLTGPVAVPETAQVQGASFADLIGESLETLESRIDRANTMVQRFAVDESVPIHQVTMALGRARLSVELATQMRTQIVESYRQVMNMQI